MTAGRVAASDLVVDARGLRCPWPALRLARAMRGGDMPLLLLADDPAAEREATAVAAAAGWRFERLETCKFRVVPPGA